MPVSSRASRTAASLTSSPASTKPEGNDQHPILCSWFRFVSRISPARSATTPPRPLGPRSERIRRPNSRGVCVRRSRAVRAATRTLGRSGPATPTPRANDSHLQLNNLELLAITPIFVRPAFLNPLEKSFAGAELALMKHQGLHLEVHDVGDVYVERRLIASPDVNPANLVSREATGQVLGEIESISRCWVDGIDRR